MAIKTILFITFISVFFLSIQPAATYPVLFVRIGADRQRAGFSIHVKQLFQFDGDRRVVIVYLHNIRHEVPPSLHDRVGADLLGGLLSMVLLYCKQYIGLLIPENGIIFHSVLR